MIGVRRRHLVSATHIIYALIVYAVLLIPPLIIVLTSFTSRQFPTLPTDGIDFRWYVELLNDSRLMDALVTTFFVAVTASTLAVSIATIAAFGFVRSDVRFKESLSLLVLLPLMISPVITGVAWARYGHMIGLPSGFPRIVLGHSVLHIPISFLIIRAQLLTFNEDLEDASRVLGANRLESVLNVTLPNIFPAMFAAYVIAFIGTFGEFTATQFLVSPSTTTVPVIIFTMLREGLSPIVSALSTVLIVIMLAGALIHSLYSEITG